MPSITHLQLVLDATDFDRMLVLLHINGHRMEVMDLEALMRYGVLVLDLVVVLRVGGGLFLRLMLLHRCSSIELVLMRQRIIELVLLLQVVERFAIVVDDAGLDGRTCEQRQRDLCVGVSETISAVVTKSGISASCSTAHSQWISTSCTRACVTLVWVKVRSLINIMLGTHTRTHTRCTSGVSRSPIII